MFCKMDQPVIKVYFHDKNVTMLLISIFLIACIFLTILKLYDVGDAVRKEVKFKHRRRAMEWEAVCRVRAGSSVFFSRYSRRRASHRSIVLKYTFCGAWVKKRNASFSFENSNIFLENTISRKKSNFSFFILKSTISS